MHTQTMSWKHGSTAGGDMAEAESTTMGKDAKLEDDNTATHPGL